MNDLFNAVAAFCIYVLGPAAFIVVLGTLLGYVL
jgi:hypothetical protein